jgi:hypothetical protein
MKTLPLVLGAALVLAPALAHAQEAPSPVAPPLAPVAQWVAPQGFAVPQAPPTQRRNVGLMIGGIVLAGLGGAQVIGGAAFLSSAASEQARCGSQCGLNSLGIGLDRAAGTFFTVNGGLMLASGVAMAIVGGAQVPVVGPHASGSLVPAVAVGAGNATLHWSF